MSYWRSVAPSPANAIVPEARPSIAGHFHVDGVGTDRATLAMSGGGRLRDASLFHGTLSDADVSMDIEHGTLRASYDGRLSGVEPAIPFADPRFEASLTGSGKVTATVRDLLIAERTTIADYDVAGTLTLEQSTVRGLPFYRAQLEAALRDSTPVSYTHLTLPTNREV